MHLALDTAAPRANLALGDEAGALLAEASAAVGARRSEALLPALDRLLSTTGRDPAEITAVILGAGPGSYTGVRIAAAAAKGVVHALRRPLYAHGSLEAMSAGVGGPARALLPLLPARRGEVFAACHLAHGGDLRQLAPPALLDLDAAIVLARKHDAVAIGAGAASLAPALRAAGVAADPELGLRPAAGLLRLHAARGERGRVEQPHRWEPVYLGPDGGGGDGQPAG